MAVNVYVNLEVVDPSLDAEDLQGAARNLLKQVRAVDGVESADLIAVTDVPAGAMALGFLKDRIVGKTLKMSVEAYGKKIAIEGSSQVEFEYALQKANEQIAQWASESQSGN